jgi:hypothetical protein
VKDIGCHSRFGLNGGLAEAGRCKMKNALLGGLCSLPAGLFVLVAAAFFVELVAGGAEFSTC